MNLVVNRKGHLYGEWTIIGPSESRKTEAGKARIYWRARCSCGEIHWVSSKSLHSGMSTRCRSCGIKGRCRSGPVPARKPPKGPLPYDPFPALSLGNPSYLTDFECAICGVVSGPFGPPVHCLPGCDELRKAHKWGGLKSLNKAKEKQARRRDAACTSSSAAAGTPTGAAA